MPDTRPNPRAESLDPQILPRAREAVREAAGLAKPFFREGAQTRARVWSKAGGSPVTEADVAVDAFLKVRLSEIEPRAKWLSEETTDDSDRIGADLVWIVDPIDGTRAFLSGHPDWSIAVALLARGEPVLGFVDAPALGLSYEAIAGNGATRNGTPIRVSGTERLDGARVSGPKPLFDRMTRGAVRLGPAPQFEHLERVPSLALRVARVAEGSIDLGLVGKGSRDWDLAAADLVLREAGGAVLDFHGAPAVYNRAEPLHGELIAASPALSGPALEALRAG